METTATAGHVVEGAYAGLEVAETVAEASVSAAEIAATSATIIAETSLIVAATLILEERVVGSTEELLAYIEAMEAEEEGWWELDLELIEMVRELQRMFPCDKRGRR